MVSAHYFWVPARTLVLHSHPILRANQLDVGNPLLVARPQPLDEHEFFFLDKSLEAIQPFWLAQQVHRAPVLREATQSD